MIKIASFFVFLTTAVSASTAIGASCVGEGFQYEADGFRAIYDPSKGSASDSTQSCSVKVELANLTKCQPDRPMVAVKLTATCRDQWVTDDKTVYSQKFELRNGNELWASCQLDGSSPLKVGSIDQNGISWERRCRMFVDGMEVSRNKFRTHFESLSNSATDSLTSYGFY